MHFILSFFVSTSAAWAAPDVASLEIQVRDYLALPPTAGRVAWPMFQEGWKGDAAHVEGALRAIVADERPFEKEDNRIRLIRHLVSSTRDQSSWPAGWREQHAPNLHDLLNVLLERYQLKHAQMERVVDLFDLLQLWGPDQADWLTAVYLNKLWPRLVVPWLRALEHAPDEVKREIVESVRLGNRVIRINFIGRAAAFSLSPPTTAAGIHRIFAEYVIDAADEGTLGSAPQGLRVLSSPGYLVPEAGAEFRREVHALFIRVFERLRKRFHRGGARNEVVEAVTRARKKHGYGRKTPKQDALMTQLLDHIVDENSAPLRKFLDPGAKRRSCRETLSVAD